MFHHILSHIKIFPIFFCIPSNNIILKNSRKSKNVEHANRKIRETILAHIRFRENMHPFRVNVLNSNLFHASDYWGVLTQKCDYIYRGLLFVFNSIQKNIEMFCFHIFWNLYFSDKFSITLKFQFLNHLILHFMPSKCKNWWISIWNIACTCSNSQANTHTLQTRLFSKSEPWLIYSLIGFCGFHLFIYVPKCLSCDSKEQNSILAYDCNQWYMEREKAWTRVISAKFVEPLLMVSQRIMMLFSSKIRQIPFDLSLH